MLIRRSKSIIALLLVALMSIAVIGCGSTEGGQTDTPADEPQGATSELRPEGVPENFPNKEIKYIYGFSAGSVQDAYIRILGDKIQKMEGWDHGLVVEYREGASGRIGWSATANAEPDGYTIGFCPSAMLISSISEDVPYGYENISFIFNMMSDPGAIGVVKGSPYKSLQDLVDAAKEKPGDISVGVTSTIGQEGLTMKLIEKQAGVEFNAVAFNGGADVLAAIVGGHIDAFCLNITDCTTFIEEGQIVVLATGNEERSQFLPDVPTYKEAGYDVIQLNMRGVGGPKDMPEPIRQYLENCFVAAANDPEVKAKAEEMQIPLDTLTGVELRAKFAGIAEGLQQLWDEDPWQ